MILRALLLFKVITSQVGDASVVESVTLEDLDARLRALETCTVVESCSGDSTDADDSGVVWSVSANVNCGVGGSCENENNAYSNAGSRYESATRDDVSHCKTACELDEDCGGFNFDEDANRCYFRRSTTCNSKYDSTRDCYTIVSREVEEEETTSCLAGSEPTGYESDPLFAPLSEAEMEEAFALLKERGLINTNLGENPTLGDNYVYGMALENPNKEDVLRSRSMRYADVHLHRGIENDLAEFVVGPLGTGTADLTLRGTYNYNARPRDGIEWDQFEIKVFEVYDVLRDLLVESFDGAYQGNGLYFHPQAPPGLNADDRETRFCAALVVDGCARCRDMHFLPLTGTISNPGTDTSTWYAHSLYYLNQGPFDTAEALLEAYNSGTIRKMALPDGYRDNLMERTIPQPLYGGAFEEFRAGSETAGPTADAVEQRFTIDGHKVSYLGWTFEIGASQFKGPGIYDIKFLGQSIAYEISLQEVGVVYSSDTSSGSNTIYLDATFGIGEFQDLMPGVDCPHYAAVVEATWFNGYSQSPVTAKSICIFEVYDGSAMWRRKDKFMSGARDYKLVVRTPMAVGNYDYLVSYIFKLDGVLKTEAQASGFLQTTYWDPDSPLRTPGAMRDPFGFRVSDYTHGTMHDHSIGFKVDMDILGQSNTMKTYEWKAGTPVEAFNSQEGIDITEKPNYFLYDETRYIEEQTLTEETGLNINLQTPKWWIVQNEGELNRWGVPRGYRIKPELPPTQVLNEHPSVRALGYTKYHAMVTKRKEEERFISGNYDLNQLNDYEIDAREYINGESIEEEDLVLWMNIGFLHIPIAEDVPMTNVVGSSFSLKPFNFFDWNPAFDLPSYVDTSDGSPLDIHTREPTADDCKSNTAQRDYFA